MLKGISPLLSPELLKLLCEMGHGDELVLADAHFPGHSLHTNHILRYDGTDVATLLDAILPLFELDTYSTPLAMMAVVSGDTLDPHVENDYMKKVHHHSPLTPRPERLDRFAFYQRAKDAYLIIITGELRKYGNLILKKGVTPIARY